MRLSNLVLALSLLAVAALLLVFAYYAVASIWGYGDGDPRWEYGLAAIGEVALAGWLGITAFRVLIRH